jgi:hypothetical protein
MEVAMVGKQPENRVWLLALAVLVLAIAAWACGGGQETEVLMCTPPPCKKGEVYYCPGDCPGGCGTICVTPTPKPTETATPHPTGEVDTGMGGDLSIQGTVWDSFGNAAPDVYVFLVVYGEEGGWHMGRFGGWGVYTDETGFYSFKNLARVAEGHYEVWFNGQHEYGKVYENAGYWVAENEISGDEFVLNVTVHPVTGSAFSGVIRYEDMDGSTESFYSHPFTKQEPGHFIELFRGTPDNREYPIGGEYCKIYDDIVEWDGLAGGTYFLEFTYRRRDGVLLRCTSPPIQVPSGETQHFQYTIRNCPPMPGQLLP